MLLAITFLVRVCIIYCLSHDDWGESSPLPFGYWFLALGDERGVSYSQLQRGPLTALPGRPEGAKEGTVMRAGSVKGIILAGAVAVLMLGLAAAASAGVDVSISIPLFGLYLSGPPVIAAPPAPAPYYGYGAVAAPVFYGGLWYHPRGGNWFVSAQVGGPWYAVGAQQVPAAVIGAPVPGYVVPQAPVVIEQPAPVYRDQGFIYLDERGGRDRHGRGGHGRGGHDD